MEKDPLRYDRWVEEALREVIRRSLELASTEGLPGEHHFYITFQTKAAGVDIPLHLSAEHPLEMTIVLQHQFSDLEVGPDRFSVTLQFSGKPTRLTIPYSAVVSFADPAVNFGLQLKVTHMPDFDEDDSSPEPDGIASFDPEAAELETTTTTPDAPDEDDKMGEVIALDAFRKK